MRQAGFLLAPVPALTELLPSTEPLQGHPTHRPPAPLGQSPQPCSAVEDKPFLVAAAAPALSPQVLNVLKLLSKGSSVPDPCRAQSSQPPACSCYLQGSPLCFSVKKLYLNPSCLLSDTVVILWGRTDYSRGT